MATYEIGGVLIVLCGLMAFAASTPALHVVPREGDITALLGSEIVTWLMRAFAAIVTILGLVTMLQ